VDLWNGGFDLDFEGKVAVITGGGRGIGRAIALDMAMEGADIVIADVNTLDVEKVLEDVEKYGTKGLAIKVDISKFSDIEKMKESIITRFGKIDFLVNNAGITQKVEIEDLTEQDWDRVLNINLKGTFFCSQLIFSEMKKRKFGKIINIASMAGERGGRFAGVNYSSSKAGIIVMTKCFAMRGGSYNINVNAIAPGLINSEMSKQLDFATNDIPLGRLGTPEEVADLTVFLASEKSRYITGATIDINGGIFMR
jgi:Dehydrogenases with different specificities (related to short-chain alcohol dehydrogenases)